MKNKPPQKRQVSMKTILGLLILSVQFIVTAPALATVVNGVADLRNWDPSEQAMISLDGEWEFYWQEFLDAENPNSEVKSFIHVPGSWNRIADYPFHGYASYRAKILLSEPMELTFWFKRIWSASRILINGEEVASFGTVGTSPESYFAHTGDLVISLYPVQNEFEIIVQVASFEFFLAGISQSINVGVGSAIRHNQRQDVAQGFFLIGSLLIMSIYHFCLFVLRRTDKSTLYFALVCSLISIHLSVGRGDPIEVLIGPLSMTSQLRIFNFGWILIVPAYCFFAHTLFPRTFSIKIAYSSLIIASGFIVHIMTTSPREFVNPTLMFQIWTGFISIYALFAIGLAAWRRHESAKLFLAGIVIVILGATHDMLMTLGLFQSYALGGAGVFAFIFFQSYLIAKRFSNAFQKVEISEKEIRSLSQALQAEHNQVLSLNQNLEHMVEEKTRDIRSMMTHVQIGIFTIVGKDRRIHKDYSQHLKEIFECDELADMDAKNVIFEACDLSSDEICQASSALEMCLGEALISFDANAHCLPIELHRKRQSDGSTRILELTWNAIADEDDVSIEKILVTVRDVTELRILQEEASEQREELEFISELLNVSPEAFQRFVRNCNDFIDENRKLLQSKSIEKKDIEIIKMLFINMHTMKGAARSLYLKKVSSILHETEQYYAKIQSNPDTEWDIEKMRLDLIEIEAMLHTYETINHEKLGRKSNDHYEIQLPGGKLGEIYQSIRNIDEQLSEPVRASLIEIQNLLFPKLYSDANSIFQDIFSCTRALAKDLGKDQPQIELDCQDIYFNHRGEEVLRNVFVHIVRNSMDHGLEQADVRKKNGKPAQGKLKLSINHSADGTTLTYGDDGQGLNLDKIRAIAVSRGLISADTELSRKEVAELIFHSGLSTAGRVDDVSGRGVGMDAVRKYLERAGGRITIQLLEDAALKEEGFQNFTFLIDLPVELCASGKDDMVCAA